VDGRGKTSCLFADSPTPVTGAWILDNNVLLYQILTAMKLKIQDLVLHCIITLKELWCFLKDLHGGRGNINIAYDVIQQLFRKKQDGRPWMLIMMSSII